MISNNLVDFELLNDVKEYNHNRKNNSNLEKNKKYESILCSRYNKFSRIKKRLVYLLNHRKNLWFCTFTFDEDYINKCDRTKRDLIKDVLSDKDFLYMMNVDYGKKTEREHYHVILGTDYDIDLDSFIHYYYPCHCNAKLINRCEDDLIRLSKYINKLSNHCIKDSTKKKKMYFSFKLPYENLDSYSKRIRYYRELALLDKG